MKLYNQISIVLLSVLLIISPTAIGAGKDPTYWDWFSFYHMKMGTNITEKELDCWNFSYYGKDYRKGETDEFFLEDIRNRAMKQIQEKLALLPSESTLFKFSVKNIYWHFDKYDSNSQSFPVQSYGYLGDSLSSYYIETGGGGSKCMTGRMELKFRNNERDVNRAVAFKIPREKAKSFLRNRPSNPRGLYVDLYFYLRDAYQSPQLAGYNGADTTNKFVLTDLVQVDFYNDSERRNFLYSVKLNPGSTSSSKTTKTKASTNQTSNAKKPRALSTSKANLKKIQAGLNAAGFNAGTPDGIWGKGSARAYRAWQESIGETPTGYVTRKGWNNFVEGR